MIQLLAELLAVVKPRTRFIVELQGATLILHSEGTQPFWRTASSSERAESAPSLIFASTTQQ